MNMAFDFLNKDSKRLADFGWTVAGNLTPIEINEIANKLLTKEDVDNFFVKHYSNPDYLFRICDAIYSSEIFDDWHKLLDECIFAYRQGLYLVTVPALLTVVDGAIAKIHNTTGTKLIALCLEQATKEVNGSVKQYFWISIQYFLQKVFSASKFDTEKPVTLNRHWILHGRNSVDWGNADCLRLMQALDSLVTATKSKKNKSYLQKWINDSKYIK